MSTGWSRSSRKPKRWKNIRSPREGGRRNFGDVMARMNLRNYRRSSRFFDSMFQNCIRFSISVGRTCMCVSVIFEWIILKSRRSQILSRSLPLLRYRVNQSGLAGSFHPSCAVYASDAGPNTCSLSMGNPRSSGKTRNQPTVIFVMGTMIGPFTPSAP